MSVLENGRVIYCWCWKVCSQFSCSIVAS